MTDGLKIFIKHTNKRSNALRQKVSSHDSPTRDNILFLGYLAFYFKNLGRGTTEN